MWVLSMKINCVKCDNHYIEGIVGICRECIKIYLFKKREWDYWNNMYMVR